MQGAWVHSLVKELDPFKKKMGENQLYPNTKLKVYSLGEKWKINWARWAFLTPWLGQVYLFIDTLGMVGKDVLQLLKSVCPRACALQQEMPLQWNAL